MPNRYETQTRAESVRPVRLNMVDCASRWEAMKAIGSREPSRDHAETIRK